MEKLYSIVICPPAEEIQEVKRMKELLASKIKWYNSKNLEVSFYGKNLIHQKKAKP